MGSTEPSEAILDLPVSSCLGSCHLKENVLLPKSRASKISVSGSCWFHGVVNVNPLHSDLFIKVGASERLCMRLKRPILENKPLCSQRIGALCHHFDPTKRRDRCHFGKELHFLNRSLRHIAARSDIVRSGAAEVASPFPEASFGPKARGVCFYAVTATVAIFIFVMMVVSHPFVLLFDRYQRSAQHFFANMWATLTINPFFNVEIEGLDHLPQPDTPAVYVSNHQSFLDIYTLLTLGRSFKFISKTSIFLYPIIGWAMYLMGVIPLKRMDSRSQLDCLKRCIDLIQRGASVFFFPEGTRSKDGQLGAFKKGAFSVAAKTQVPVVPMTIIGTGSIMPAGQEGMLNPGSVKVIIHPCLTGNDAQILCNQARTVIANALEQQG
ncbi:1-acyl-sn-glycerol-3-phosphate acyltransferase 1 chloroplastic [Bienertia sinuspersici]